VLDYLRAPGLLDRPEVADRLEAEVRREGVRTAADAAARLGFPLEEIDALRDPSVDTAAELARHARRLLAAPHRGSAALLDPEEERDARAVAAVLHALEELSALGERLGGAELIDLLADLPVPAGSTAGACGVLLNEPLAIRARRFRAVFVCGLQEGEFPRLSAPDPLLSDEDRRDLAATTGLRLSGGAGGPADALARERYLFYTCVARATDQVVLSYRSSDEEGNLALPSPFIADVADLLASGWADRRRKRLVGDVVWPEPEASGPAPRPRRWPRRRASRRPWPPGSRKQPSGTCATARSSRAARSSRSPSAPSGGSSSASCNPLRLSRTRTRFSAAVTCTRCSSRCSSSSARP
jgi:hypothetical protein